MSALQTPADVLDVLEQHERKDLLRFVTIGSVDDGKSTLIGRLLYESGGVFSDQLESVTIRNPDGTTEINFANLTDGLVAEREQGITIDVAYRYFSTARRKFIIADTPGHVQYTRNMATGASTANAAIILIDARLGVLQQSRRHAYIANLLGIPHLLVAVNKMDLVGFAKETYEDICRVFSSFAERLNFQNVSFFPVSALKGDNVVARSTQTPWYGGKTLLEHLETLEVPSPAASESFVFPVQLVLRPNLNFRGYAGTLASGRVRKGDPVKVLPSGQQSRVKSIVTYTGDLEEAIAPMSVTLTLDDEIDISRGDMLVPPDNDLHVSRRLEAMVVWMNETPLELGRQYLFKHTTNMVTGKVDRVLHKVSMDTLENESTETLGLNDVGRVVLSLNRPIVMDLYGRNRTAGSFILIDRVSNATVGAGMIQDYGADYQDDSRTVERALTAAERAQRFSQKPTVLLLTGRPGGGKIVVARSLERRLFDSGHMPFVLDPGRMPSVPRNAEGDAFERLLDQVELSVEAGLLTVVAFTAATAQDRARARARLEGKALFLEVYLEAELETCQGRLVSLGQDPGEAQVAYEPPQNPDLVVNGDELNIEREVDRLVRVLEQRGALIR